MIVRYSRELDAIQNGCLFMMARLFNSDVFIETTNHIGHHLFSVTRSGGEVGSNRYTPVTIGKSTVSGLEVLGAEI